MSNVIWAMDFHFDTTADGRTIKMLNVIDEFTREALAIEIDRSIDADGVVAVLDRLALQRGAPVYVRFENGPEFVAHAVADWCRFNHTASTGGTATSLTPVVEPARQRSRTANCSSRTDGSLSSRRSWQRHVERTSC